MSKLKMFHRLILVFLAFSTSAISVVYSDTDEAIFEEMFSTSPLVGKGDWEIKLGQESAVKTQDIPLTYEAADASLSNPGKTWVQKRVSEFRKLLAGVPEKYLDRWGFIGKEGATVYIAFLFESLGGGDRSARFSLGAVRFPDDAGGERITIERSSDSKLIARFLPAGQYAPFEKDLGSYPERANLVVLKVEFGKGSNGADRVSIWVNPDRLQGGEPNPPTTVLDEFPSSRPNEEGPAYQKTRSSLAFNQLQAYSGTMQMKDKDGSTLKLGAIRIGPTFESVVPVEK